MQKKPAAVDREMQKITNPGSHPNIRVALLASGAMAFAGIGDAVLYPVLPVYAEALGIPLVWVGVLLSINRLVRVLSNTWIANGIHNYGEKKVLTLATVIAVVCTGLYGLDVGLFALLLVRVCWGISYSGLKTATYSYAAMADARSGLAFGMIQSIRSLGVVLALVIGPMLINYFGLVTGFLILALLSAVAIPLTRKVPDYSFNTKGVTLAKTFALSPLNLITFIFSIAIDGILVVVLAVLISKKTSNTSALLTMVAFYLFMSRMFMVGVSLLVGVISLKVSSIAIFTWSVVFCLMGLLLIALDLAVLGIVTAFFFNAVLISFAPLIAVSLDEENHLQSISGVSTWWDLGAGIGAFSGLLLIDWLGQRSLFLVVTALGAVVLVYFLIHYAKSNRLIVSTSFSLYQEKNQKH